MGNFDFLLKHREFDSFSKLAVQAEKLASLDPTICVQQCRKTTERATAWIYSVDKHLEPPQDTKLSALHADYKFRRLVGKDLCNDLYYLRKVGNLAVHGERDLTQEQALQVLNLLFRFVDWIAQIYASDNSFRRFSSNLALQAGKTPLAGAVSPAGTNAAPAKPAMPPMAASNAKAATASAAASQSAQDDDEQLNAKELKAELERLKKQLSEVQPALNAKARENQDKYQKPASDISEEQTRKFLIDTRLRDAGWRENLNWKNEVELEGMPTQTGKGYADYVLYADDGSALAVIEAKRFSQDIAVGRHQAQLYRDAIFKKTGDEPVVYLTNGREIYLNDGVYPERRVSSFMSKDDLVSRRNLLRYRKPLKDIDVRDICGRYYQLEAVDAVCRHFEKRFRKALLVMATGSGKTRTVLGIIKALTSCGLVRNVLFLADRTALVNQAFGAAKNLINDFTLANLSDSKLKKEDRDPHARIVFSTYPAMMSRIDEVKDKDGVRVFTPGHFDLIICDEAHRSIYNRYQAIFEYFDALLVGLTATPKDEIDRNTYRIFDLEDGNPTYYFSYQNAVKDGYLVDYHTLKLKTKFLIEGIKYDDLPQDQKDQWDETFVESVDDDGELPVIVSSAAINKWLFNEDTIKKILDHLMTAGLKLDNGDLLGKSIIFARNHRHAEEIVRIFGKNYPNLGPDFCQVIDNKIKYHDDLIEQFKKPQRKPQIAVSVDMLDTGIDVPECLNLVFFKPVFSKAKFWQMIGRGTRTCKGLIDGQDKQYFLIIDACGNFEFFETDPKGMDGNLVKPLEQRTYETRLKLLHALEGNSDIDSGEYRQKIASELAAKVHEVAKDSFAALSHVQTLERYEKPESYKGISKEDIESVSSEIGSLLSCDRSDPIDARRFDCLMYSMELGYVSGDQGRFKKALKILCDDAEELLEKSIPQVRPHEMMLKRILNDDFIEAVTLDELERIRMALRSLCVYLDSPGVKQVFTDFVDTVVDVEYIENYGTQHAADEDLEPYRLRIERYVRAHKDEGVIGRIFRNETLGENDLAELEQIVWTKLGSREEFKKEFADQDLGIFIRKITGLEQQAALMAFADFIADHSLSVEQSSFIRTVVDYVQQNGLVESNQELMESPFDGFDLVGMMEDRPEFLAGIQRDLEKIRNNAKLRGRL